MACGWEESAVRIAAVARLEALFTRNHLHMSFADFPSSNQAVTLLQRSLARGRVGHAYLFSGEDLNQLEALARALAKTLNCQNPVRKDGMAMDSCDACRSCSKIDQSIHPDIHWARPEAKSRIITVLQMRELTREIHLKPTEASHKVAVITSADRLNVQAANAFLKTLEEPPSNSVLILLSTDPSRILETILSRCLRLNISFATSAELDPADREWLESFGSIASGNQKSLLSRYRLLDSLLKKLNDTRTAVEEALTRDSMLEKYDDLDPGLRESLEETLKASIEAEYRRRRTGVLSLFQACLRDVWIHTLNLDDSLLSHPRQKWTGQLSKKISSKQAMENLQALEATQRLLYTNVQESLALEVGLLKLHF